MMNVQATRALPRLPCAFAAFFLAVAAFSVSIPAGEKTGGDGLPPLLLESMNDLDGSGVRYVPAPPAGGDIQAPVTEKAPAKNPAGKTVPGPEKAAAASGNFDVLPLTFAEMDKYDQIAMESYRDRYDYMTIGEKAKVYGQVFEFMHDRPPRFDAKITTEEKRFTESSGSRNAVAAKQYMYKPPTPKKRRPAAPPATGDAAAASEGALLGRLPGPWGDGPEASAENDAPPDPVAAEPDEPSYDDYKNDNRMENLRQGWNAADVLRGRRVR